MVRDRASAEPGRAVETRESCVVFGCLLTRAARDPHRKRARTTNVEERGRAQAWQAFSVGLRVKKRKRGSASGAAVFSDAVLTPVTRKPHVHHLATSHPSHPGTLAAGPRPQLRHGLQLTQFPTPRYGRTQTVDATGDLSWLWSCKMRHLRALCNNPSGRHSKIRPYPEDGAHNR